MTSSLPTEYQSIEWPLRSFTIAKDAKSSSLITTLFLDRANGEFGFVQYASSASASVLRFPDTDEPIYFQAKSTRAAAWREKCRKISVLFQHLQIDLEFYAPEKARGFLDMLEDLAMAAGNHFFYTYEVPMKIAFVKADFDMAEQGFTSRVARPWMAVATEASEWPRLRKTGEWSDFQVIAGGSKFPVHRIKICKESFYFKAVCSQNFLEGTQQSIELPETALTIDTMLDEMYGVYNPTTGSIFTNFALRMEIEKERIMNQLFDLFIAADKYSLEAIKRKASSAIIDRLPFISDALMIVDLATCIHDEQCPQNDRGLRKAIIAHIQMRMPDIIADESAWEEFSGNKVVLRAFHQYQCEMSEGDEVLGGLLTPPVTPRK